MSAITARNNRMERYQLALVAIALLLSIIEGGADQFNLRSAGRPNHHADDQRRALSDGYSLPHPSSSSGGSSSGSSSSSSSGGGSSSSSSGGGSSESSSGGGSESSSGSDGSASESTEEESESTEDEAIPGWLSEYFSWMGGGDDGSDLDPDAGTRSFWSPTGSFARGENGAVNGWPLAMMALTAFVAGIAFMVARKSCRDREDDGAPKRKRRWRRGILARKVPVGEDGEEFVEMSFIPTKFTKSGWRKKEAKAGAGAQRGSDYKAPKAADGLVRESSGSSASSGLPAAYSLANSSSSSSASSSVVIV